MCEQWSTGQAASLRRGLQALEGAEKVVVTLGDAPLVTPTESTPSNQAGSISPALSMRYDALAPASSATSTRRTEFEELAEPTTMTRSAPTAICLTASWRFWVA